MNVFIWAVVIFTLFFDQVSKFFVLHNLSFGDSTVVVKNIFYITLVYNTGAAFGIFKNQTLFFIFISLLAVIAIFVFLRSKSKRQPLRDIGFALVLGGALGNLVDRLRFGYVIDFLDFRVWPVFNIADSAISIGTLLVIVSMIWKNPKH